MKAATQRKIIRWIHIILSIPILGYIYGPVASMPAAANAVRFVFLPVVIISGFWMWLGHKLRKKGKGVVKDAGKVMAAVM
ncbi:hypothetical protein F0L74_25535 [Chitinophaga agrisoli]|uniref:PepSY-associated transmembrane protein n=1 Tax=Chitinophaga agrisoli TaxID=2607653 RepID=A0A5B2VJ07_9BACT|nr:hypothetical protein [Chitinophaga agrisoli]KAA2239563.1 hypothetical protein F0L74_25535 [Chitinophaga agrisoli]